MTTATIGEIALVQTDAGLVARFNCGFLEAASLSIIVLDQLGRTRLQKNMELPQGEHTVELKTTDLDKGNYNAWVYLDEQTFIRPFRVEGGGGKGMFGGLFRFLD